MSTISWTENDTLHTARWHSENGTPAAAQIVIIDDSTSANNALRLARSGTGLLWRGDFHNARHLLRAMDRRLAGKSTPPAGRRSGKSASGDRRSAKGSPPASVRGELGAVFHAQRETRSRRAALLGSVLIELEVDRSIDLGRAPDVRAACEHAYGEPAHELGEISRETTVISLPELLGVMSAYEWHRKGIDITAVGGRLHPAYGVFAPTRDEYIDLLAAIPFPVADPLVFDIGTGTGVLAAVLARRGARQVLATDLNPRAVRCAHENIRLLGLDNQVHVTEADLWPDDTTRADLIVCNPPWLPGIPTSALELGIYDAASDMLNRFLGELVDHLTAPGEGWLILSDLAEHLGLRTREELLARIAAAGLEVLGTHETAPRHSRAADDTDPLHAARALERTMLWRLAPQR
ncbi:MULTISPECIES: methyltransferase [unclassified Nocardia]|uniref:methyltransferase n=1 Tax=unclassified Nocardia TaxID=2637762 RepID=UPI0035E38E23